MEKQKDLGPTIKNDVRFEVLSDEGYSRQRAVRIANTNPLGKVEEKVQRYEDHTSS